MLLTVSTTHQPATNLCYLLHKNPARLQTEELSFGKAYVVKPLNFIAEGPTRNHPASHEVQRCGTPPHHLRPEYLLTAILERLRSRNLGAKRSLATESSHSHRGTGPICS